MAGKVGEVYYDVLPNLDRFASMVASGIGNQKPIKVGVDADTRQAVASLKNATGATSGLTAAQNRLISAQGAARVSALRLNETKAKAAVGSARLASAEESHSRALRNLGIAQAAAFAAIPQAQTNYQKFNKVLGDPAIQRAGTGMVKFGAAGALAIGGIVAVSANFEQAVSRVASTGDDAKASIGRLSSEALKYGAATAFSATEAANAQSELIKANVSVTDTINGGLKGALDLAAAGELDVATAAGIMGTAMSQFKVPGTEASHVADLMAAAAGKAQGEVVDFSEALKYVGPLAHGAGISIDETVGTLAAFANVGILGSQAGTTFRGVLVGLTAPSAAGAKEMAKYGISVRDASGQFIGMEGAAGQLAEKLGGLSDAERDAALARIFGRNSLTGARELYNLGARGIENWTNAVNDSGFAAEVAATKQNNLKGDIEKLTGAFETAFIKTGKSAQGPARQFTQAITGIVDAYSNLSDQAQGGILIGTVIAAAAVLVVGAGIKIVGAISAINASLVTMSATAPRAAGALGAIGKIAGPLAIAATAIAGVGIALDHFGSKAPAVDQVTTSLEGIAKGSNDLSGLYSGGNWADDLGSSLFLSMAPANNLKDALNRLGVEYDPLASGATKASLSFLKFTESIIPGAQSLEKAKQQVDQVDAALAQMVASGNAEGAKKAFDAIWKDSGQPLETLLPQFKQYEAALGGVKTGTEGAAAASQKALSALNGVGDAVNALSQKTVIGAAGVEALTKSLFGQADAASAAVNAELAYEASIDAAREAAQRNGETLNENTAKGRENVAALQQQGAASRAYVSSLIAQGKSQGQVVGATREARAAVIANARAMGASKGEAAALADSLGLIPKDVKTKYELQKAKEEQAKMDKLTAALQGIPKEQATKIKALIDQGKFKEAEALIAALKKEVQPPIKPKLFPGDIRVAENALNSLSKPVAPQIKPKLFPGDVRVAENALNTLKKPVTPPISPKLNMGAKNRAENQLKPLGNGINPRVNVRTTGVPKAKADIKGIKGTNVTANVKERGVAKTKRDINSIKGVTRSADIRERGVQKTKQQFKSIPNISRTANVKATGVSTAQRSIRGIRGVGVDAHVIATGVGNAQRSINGIHGKTVIVTVKTVKVSATGGLYNESKVPKFASGGLGQPGLIRGPGGPTGDLINARLSDYEFVQRAAAVRKYGVSFMEQLNNLSIDPKDLPGFRAGALAQAVPARYAPSSSGATAVRSAPTRVTLNVDLGRELGGLRQFVYDIIDDGQEHELTLGRMN